MGIARFIRIPTEDQASSRSSDIENPQPEPNECITINIPTAYWKGLFWDKKVVNVDKDNVASILNELYASEKELDCRINNADYIGQLIHDGAVLLIALLQLVKVSRNKINNVPQNNNDTFNVLMDSVCIGIPLVTTFISKVMTNIRNNAIKNKVEALDGQRQLRPK